MKIFFSEWIATQITNKSHELVIIRKIIPWQKIINRLYHFYDTSKGAYGKSLRIMIAILIIMKDRQLSDRKVINQVKENRYIQYFCNVPDAELQTFLHASSICVFRKRLGEEGIAIIEEEVFETLRQAGMIQNDNILMDSTVLDNNIIYPNDVDLLFKAFSKMEQFARLHQIPVWWNQHEIKKLWRKFNLNKKEDRLAWLCRFNALFTPALKIFGECIDVSLTTQKKESKAENLFKILILLEEQTLQKINGEKHIKNRIVSIDEPEARPIVKGKKHPKCEFGTTMQMSFSRNGFLITLENFIGSPNDKTLFSGTLDLFKQRMHGKPETVVTDQGYRSQANLKTAKDIKNVFLGRSKDVSEEKKDFCCKARSATEGFIAVAKNLRGFGLSLYKGFKGDRIWSLLCQTAYNLKKFIQLLKTEKLEEQSLVKLGLA